MMRDYPKFYIDGAWLEPATANIQLAINPATEQTCGKISHGSSTDVNRAAAVASQAFRSYSRTSIPQRVELLQSIAAEYERRLTDIADAITEEMGAPRSLAYQAQAPAGLAQFANAIATLKNFSFEERRGRTIIRKEPIGVCGLITPWNWPAMMVACKVAPALATGCTAVLKPSEMAPFSAQIIAEVLHSAGVPAGVFNLVQGTGAEVGAAISAHPHIRMVSFTGSVRAGIEITRAAAATVKRVCLELGGKSPHIILEDANMAEAATVAVNSVMRNSGQTCAAATRTLIPRGRSEEFLAAAVKLVEGMSVGDPLTDAQLGPVASRAQWKRVQGYIQSGIREGARLVIGGPGLPEHINQGCFVRPTIFANVRPGMTIAREEIFGPVMSVIEYTTVEDAIAISNDSPYGLHARVSGSDTEQMRQVAVQIEAGQVVFNNAPADLNAPFGGCKESGNGREWGDYGFNEFLELKAIIGC